MQKTTKCENCQGEFKPTRIFTCDLCPKQLCAVCHNEHQVICRSHKEDLPLVLKELVYGCEEIPEVVSGFILSAKSQNLRDDRGGFVMHTDKDGYFTCVFKAEITFVCGLNIKAMVRQDALEEPDADIGRTEDQNT